ncbi:MAG: hypothetical protein K1X88_07870 [Nannocystaceae bacterium]|nr:hypothetical protein [Nannocystaceae bacterium]
MIAPGHARALGRAIALGLCVSASGCADRTGARTRAAFEGAQRRGGSDGPRGRDRDPRRPQRPTQTGASAWAQVDRMLGAAIDLLESGADEAALIDAARRWCAVDPEPQRTDSGATYVCFTDPELTVARRTFTLEVSLGGVVGFQMADLADVQSAEVAAQARTALAHHCARPFESAPANPAAQGEFSTCPVDGGSTLAIGHARRPDGAWFVSLAVLGGLHGGAPQ